MRRRAKGQLRPSCNGQSTGCNGKEGRVVPARKVTPSTEDQATLATRIRAEEDGNDGSTGVSSWNGGRFRGSCKPGRTYSRGRTQQQIRQKDISIDLGGLFECSEMQHNKNKNFLMVEQKLKNKIKNVVIVASTRHPINGAN